MEVTPLTLFFSQPLHIYPVRNNAPQGTVTAVGDDTGIVTVTDRRNAYFLGNDMVGSKHHFLNSALTRLRLRKKQKRTICPSCHSDNTELVNQIDDGEGDWKKEEYVCYDCDCEWDWTYQRPFFHWRVRIRAPGWMKIE